jgi:internalin A
VKNLSFIVIVAGVTLMVCAGPCLSARAEEQSVDQAIRSLRGIQAEKLSQADKESKAVELEKAWETLGKGGPPAAKALRKALAEDRQTGKTDDFFALAAAALLWKIGGAAESEEIARIWQSARQTVNYNYVYGTALMAARTRDPRVLPMLRALLHEKQGTFPLPQHAMTLAWPESMKVVWEMYGPGGLSALEDVLEHSGNAAELEAAMPLLAGAQQVTALPAIRRLAKHQDSDVRGTAIQCLGTFGQPQDYDLLAAGPNLRNTEGVVAHIVGLWQFGDCRAAALLTQHLDSPDEGVRQIALRALMELPCPEALAAIHKREGVAADAEEKKACRMCVKWLTDFLGTTWEAYHTKSPAEQRQLFSISRKKLEEEQFALRAADRKLTRAEFIKVAKQWQQDHRITGEKYKWVEPRHILAVATAADLPLLINVRSRMCERVSDECLGEIAKLDYLIFRLGRSRYRQDTGPLSIPYGWCPEPDTEPERAIAAIKKACGRVTIDENRPGKPVVGVRLTGFPVNDGVLSRLKGLTQLRSLELQCAQITDAGLESLKGLTQLQTLNLEWTHVTDAGLEHLKGLVQLRSLSLNATQVTDAGLKCLEGMNRLQDLDLERVRVTDPGLQCLEGLRQLQQLNLAHSEVAGAGLAHLVGLDNLKKLDLQWSKLTDAGLQHIERMKQLQDLNLAGSKITDAGLERLRGMTQLQSLDLSCTQIANQGLDALKGLNQLQELRLGRTQVTDAGLERLKSLPRLQKLDLGNTQISDTGLGHIEGMGQLRELGLAGTKVTDAGLHFLEHLGRLRQLELSNCRVTDRGIEHLKGTKRLESLYVDGTRVTDAGLNCMIGLTRLTTLHLGHTAITDAGMKRLEGLNQLRFLYLNETGITDAGLKHLVGMKQLQTLELDDTGVTDAGLEYLTGLKRLRSLSLPREKVTEAARRKLQEALPDLERCY